MTIQIIEVRDKIIINEENNTIQIIEQPNKIVISDVGVQGPKGDSGAGIASINGLTNLNQSIVIGASENDINIVSATNIHTINIPTASATKRGALSSANWQTFNSKQNALGFTPEDVANKENTTLDTSTTKYPTNNLVKTTIDLKVDKEAGKSLSTNDYTNLEKSKLAGIQNGATQNQTDAYLLDRTNHTGAQAISTVSGLQTALDDKADELDLQNHIGNTNNPHATTKTQIGLSNADNTSDLSKPISTATQTALDNKVDKIGIIGASLGSASKTPSITHNAQGQITFASEQNIQIAQSQVNNLTTDLSTKLNNALLNSKIFVGNASNVAEAQSVGGDATITNTGVLTVGNGAVISKVLSGLNIAGGTVNSTDSILIAFGKLQNQLNGVVVSNVSSVNGFTGAVNLTTTNIPEGTNKKYVSDAQLVVLGNTSNTNTGDNTVGSGLALVGNTLSIPADAITPNQIAKIKANSALANLNNATDNAIATDVVDVVGSGVITVVNGAKSVFGIAGYNLTISIPSATNSVDGYLAATDRTLFNNKFGNQANQFTALTAKSTLVDNDVLVLEDSAAAAYTKKKTLLSDVWTYTSTKTGTFTNKTLSDSTTFFGNVSDVSKKLIFSLGGAVTAKTMTIVSSHTLDRTITLPDATDTLVGRDTTDTLTNKSISASQINSGVLSSAQIPQTLSAGTYTVSSGGFVVQGIQAGVNTTNPFGYFKYNAYGTFSPGVGSIGINATNRIYTQYEFVVASDERIKNIINKSDSKADLEILKQIQITDYQYKDKLRYGDKIHKKVIAQQIQPIFPQAVSTTTGFVPDIMKMASVSDHNRINLSNTNLVAGDFVRLVMKNHKEVDVQVVAVKEKYFEVKSSLEDQIQFSLEDQEVFVYGKRVDDFHIVDYDALNMLAISTIQQLHSTIQELDAKLNNFINSKN